MSEHNVQRRFTVFRKDRWSPSSTAGCLPDSERVQRYLGLHLLGNHSTSSALYVEVIEEVLVTWTSKGKLSQMQATVSTRVSSPTVEWDLLRKDRKNMVAHMAVEQARALCQAELVGEAADHAVYNLFWLALRKSKPFRAWVREQFPDWYQAVAETLDKKETE